MEYFPLGDLDDHLATSPQLPENEVREIVFQLLEGLNFLHENGFAHRDLKPSNVFIKAKPPENWWIKIGDFGISKRAGDGAQACSTLKGTLGFMAPELHGFVDRADCFDEDAAAGARAADMWSLGEITFQLLAKEASFENLGILSSFVHKSELFPVDVLQKRNISLDGIDLVRSFMQPGPRQRISADRAIIHAWVAPCRTPSPRPLSLVSLESLDVDGKVFPAYGEIHAEPSGRWSTISIDKVAASRVQDANTTRTTEHRTHAPTAYHSAADGTKKPTDDVEEDTNLLTSAQQPAQLNSFVSRNNTPLTEVESWQYLRDQRMRHGTSIRDIRVERSQVEHDHPNTQEDTSQPPQHRKDFLQASNEHSVAASSVLMSPPDVEIPTPRAEKTSIFNRLKSKVLKKGDNSSGDTSWTEVEAKEYFQDQQMRQGNSPQNHFEPTQMYADTTRFKEPQPQQTAMPKPGDTAMARTVSPQRDLPTVPGQDIEYMRGREKVLGNDDVAMLDSKHQQAKALYKQQKYIEAEGLFRWTLQRREKVLGKEHAGTLHSKYWLARTLFEQQKYSEAEGVFRGMAQGQEKVLGKEHADTLHSKHWLAQTLFEQQKYGEAEGLLRETTQGEEKVLGKEHAGTLHSKYWLARTLLDQQEYSEAEVLFRGTTQGEERVLGKEHEDTLNSKYWLAQTLFEQQKHSEAEGIFRETTQGQKKVLGKEHADTLDSKYWLAQTLVEQQKYSKAEGVFRGTTQGQEKVLGKEHADTLNSKCWLARTPLKEQKDSEAEGLFRETTQGHEKVLGKDHFMAYADVSAN